MPRLGQADYLRRQGTELVLTLGTEISHSRGLTAFLPPPWDHEYPARHSDPSSRCRFRPGVQQLCRGRWMPRRIVLKQLQTIASHRQQPQTPSSDTYYVRTNGYMDLHTLEEAEENGIGECCLME